MLNVRLVPLVLLSIAFACSPRHDESKEEHVRIEKQAIENDADTARNNVIQGSLNLNQLGSFPENVILTGLPDHRLVTVYKEKKLLKRSGEDYYSSSSSDYTEVEEFEDDRYQHFMPGIDLLYGYNLLNIAHYDLKQEKLNFLFKQPVLVKSLYFPSFVQDSIGKKPINRDYYLVSVYDADTNSDSLINRHDLRKFYYFNSSCSEKIQLIPNEYSAVRSEYDRANDVMYIFSRHDANHNGTLEKKEPLHIFWLDLKSPTSTKRLY